MPGDVELPLPDLPQPRRPKAFDLHLRDVSFGDLESDPAITFKPSPSVAKAWAATCRIVDLSGGRCGTGFFTDGGAAGIVIVTNAHVVDSCPTLRVEWLKGSDILSYFAKLIAIDYPHDLAILRPSPSSAPMFPEPLTRGSAPHPGDELWLAGYPHGVETPRITRAVASGYDVYQTYDDCPVAAVVLDGSVNPGNSGGPLCDVNQIVVGVVVALRRSPLFPTNTEGAPDDVRRTIDRLSHHLSAASGIGYALHPIHVHRMLEALNERPDQANAPQAKIEPAKLSMRRTDFIALQRHGATVHGENMSPIGVFSVERNGEYYAGWSTNMARIPAPRNEAWAALAPAVKKVGSNFVLHGYDVVAYRPKRPPYRYGYWAVAARLHIAD